MYGFTKQSPCWGSQWTSYLGRGIPLLTSLVIPVVLLLQVLLPSESSGAWLPDPAWKMDRDCPEPRSSWRVRVGVWSWWQEKGWITIYGRVNLGRLERLETYGVTFPHAAERKKPLQELNCFKSQRINMIKTISSVSPSLRLSVVSDGFLLIWCLLLPAGSVPPALGQTLSTSTVPSAPACGSLSKQCGVFHPRRRQRHVIKAVWERQGQRMCLCLRITKGKSL